MNEIAYDKLITVVIMCLWFVFPLGLFIAIIKQAREEKYPKMSEKTPPRKMTIPHVLNNYDHSEHPNSTEDEEDPDEHSVHQDHHIHYHVGKKVKLDQTIHH